MITHTHHAATTRALPFGGISLATCTCGARRRSDAEPIYGMCADTDGWFMARVCRASRDEYDRLQSEGYEEATESIDMTDEFERPGAQ